MLEYPLAKVAISKINYFRFQEQQNIMPIEAMKKEVEIVGNEMYLEIHKK